MTDKTHIMIREDLAEAGIPYVDDAGRYFDFHAQRHSFITNLRKTPKRIAQSLARHRSSAMTDRYTHIELSDERAVLESLPDLTLPSSESETALKTGTDDRILLKSCSQDVHMRTDTNNRGKKSIENNQTMQFNENNKVTKGTLNQPVVGSNPPSPIVLTFDGLF